MPPDIFLFNAFTEGCIAHGHGFTPGQHRVRLAQDLDNLPQFLCRPNDIVLVRKRPSAEFLEALAEANFPLPQFVELRFGRIDPAHPLLQRTTGGLRPWAWGPDSVRLLEPLLAEPPARYFNDAIAQFYSKAWSADFLRRVLACRSRRRPFAAIPTGCHDSWLCSELEAGVATETLEDTLETIEAVRGRGHQRVIVKEAFGAAGHNAIRLWEPEVLPAQRNWMARAIRDGQVLVVEPWLEREVDFSIQLEMGPDGLALRGYTGLITDRRGQFVANWAEHDSASALPGTVRSLLRGRGEAAKDVQELYKEVINLLQAKLQHAGFRGPIGIDAFIYRTPEGEHRLKPVVEINPRYTMGRVTLELMKHTGPRSRGRLALVSLAQARREGFADLSAYAAWLHKHHPLKFDPGASREILEGALCLNDPWSAQVCLAVFEVAHPAD